MVRVMILLCLFLAACDSRSKELDIQQAATNWRYQKPEGVVAPDQLSSSLRVSLVNPFPVWKEDIQASVEVSLLNTTKSHLPARTKATLFIYSVEDKQPLYWSNIDLAYGESTGPGTMSILSLPVGASKDVRIPVMGTKWGAVRSANWPDSSLYSLVPPGKYLLRMELDLYDDADVQQGTVVSNFVEFTSAPKTLVQF